MEKRNRKAPGHAGQTLKKNPHQYVLLRRLRRRTGIWLRLLQLRDIYRRVHDQSLWMSLSAAGIGLCVARLTRPRYSATAAVAAASVRRIRQRVTHKQNIVRVNM